MSNSGYTTTASLDHSLPTVIAAARNQNEYKGVVSQLVDRVRLGEGIGETWNEITLSQLTATSIGETERANNPQQVTDTMFSITPTTVVVHTIITDKVGRRIDKKSFARLGEGAMNAIVRKMDQDGLVALQGASTTLGGAGVTMVSGYVAAGSKRITSNATEPGDPPISCVLHGYQIKALYSELVSGVGTYPVMDGPTAEVFKNGFKLPVAGTTVYEDGHITIDSASDAIGAVFAKKAFVLVQEFMPRKETRREPDIGDGATALWIRSSYAYGERSAGNWAYAIKSDATTPTS